VASGRERRLEDSALRETCQPDAKPECDLLLAVGYSGQTGVEALKIRVGNSKPLKKAMDARYA
jgi:hypothetical protein